MVLCIIIYLGHRGILNTSLFNTLQSTLQGLARLCLGSCKVPCKVLQGLPWRGFARPCKASKASKILQCTLQGLARPSQGLARSWQGLGKALPGILQGLARYFARSCKVFCKALQGFPKALQCFPKATLGLAMYLAKSS